MATVRIRGGWLKIGRRNRPGEPGHPDIGLPVEPDEPDGGGEGGGEDGEYPGHPDIDPPPGIWPPPTTGHPVQPLPPNVNVPPGAIWPRPPGPIEGKFIALVHIPDHGWHFVVIDPDSWPEVEHPIAPGGTPQPKR